MWKLSFAALLLASGVVVGSGVDRLEKVDLTHFRSYRMLLDRKLNLSWADCGRVTVAPAFDPEYSIAIHRSLSGADQYSVTYTLFSDNVYQRTDGAHNGFKALAFRVKRSDVPISARSAKVLNKVWMEMLNQASTKNSDELEQEVLRAGVDGTLSEYSMRQPDGAVTRGSMWAPTGPKTARLAELTNLLGQYCRVPPSHRNTIFTEIDSKAHRLATSLPK